MNDNNNTRGIASGTPQRTDVDLPPSVARRRTSVKNIYKRNREAESPWISRIVQSPLDKDYPSESEPDSETDPDSDATVVADNTTPVKIVGSKAPPKDGDDAPPNVGDGEESSPGDGDGYESPPKEPTYDLDTYMFQTSPLGSHSYSDWKEYFDKAWNAQLTQSANLKDYISGQVKEMVKLCKEIAMREETTANNSKPVTTVDGSDTTFNPSRSSRKRKPTAKPSKKYADTPRMKAFEERSRIADEKEWQRQEDQKIEQAELELLCRLDHLQAMFWDTAFTIATYALKQKSRMSRRVRAIQGDYDLIIDPSQLSKMIAYYIIAYAINDRDAVFIGAQSTEELLATYEKNYKFKAMDCFPKIYDDQGNFRDDNARFTRFRADEIIGEWERPFRKLTIKVLYLADELFATKLSTKSGDETLKKLLTKQATSDTQDALDEVDKDTQLSRPVVSFIQAEAGRQVNKHTQKKLDRMRKKFSGGAETENQASRPGKNGQGSSKNAGARKSGSKKKSTPPSPAKSSLKKKGKNKGNQKGKKKKKVSFKPQSDKTGKKSTPKKNSKSTSRKEGGQGGRRRGGKRKRAEGR